MCGWVTLLCSVKLTEHYKPDIMEKIKMKKKFNNRGVIHMGGVFASFSAMMGHFMST